MNLTDRRSFTGPLLILALFICIPASHEGDELAALMLAQVTPLATT